jgi:hypothetical protein
MNKLHIKPITVGELEYLYDTINTLYGHTVDCEELPLPDLDQASESWQTSKQMIEKILEFQEEEELP